MNALCCTVFFVVAGFGLSVWRELKLPVYSKVVVWSCNFLRVHKIQLLQEIKNQRRGSLHEPCSLSTSIEDLPHVDECGRCDECVAKNGKYRGTQKCEPTKIPGK